VRLRDLHGFGLTLLLVAGARAETVNFDDRAGKPGPFSGPCAAQFQIDDEYAGQGIHFASTSPAVCVIAPGNPVSSPNVVTGISGGNIDFAAPIIATFFDGANPTTVFSLSLVLTSSSSSSASVRVFDSNGALLGSSTGPGPHSFVSSRIHSVTIDSGFVAADDFSFSTEPVAVPGLSLAAGALLSALVAAVGRARLRSGSPR